MCNEGTRISQAACSAGTGLVLVCGGQGICGQCRVRIMSGKVTPPTETEQQKLGPELLAQGYRLACMTRVLSNLKVDVPPGSRMVTHRLQLTGLDVEVPFEPVVQEHLVHMQPASMDDLRSDHTRLIEALAPFLAEEPAQAGGGPAATIDWPALRDLPSILRGNAWQARVSLHGREVIDVRPPDRGPLGLAVDIGTTKVAAYLVDMQNGQTLAVDGIMNPQIARGEDVMSRISCAIQGGAPDLTRAIVEGLNGLIESLCPEPERIVDVVVVGNTAMHHLFLGLPVRQLGLAPYVPAVSDPVDIKARDLGLHVAPGAYVHLLPNVAGFVGADHVAMILAAGIDRTDRTVIGLDIGTNTELVLAHQGRLTSCSTASGPAFEGAQITHGMRAAKGAVEAVRIDSSGVSIQTIEDAPAVGLCGSGVLDAISELARAGLMNRRGKLSEGPGVRLDHDMPEFVLVPAGQSGTGQDVVITQKDIGEIQLAKGAIRTGMQVLLEREGLSDGDLDEIILAGAFGTYTHPASAIGAGLLPPVPLDRVRQIGNAAGVGARLALVSRRERARAVEIAHRVHYVELMTQPNFGARFASNMFFPHS
jgi:uncharacterized 2Fe-2S/4Fe-4S cluster protein (DUF4445 family)